MTATLHGWTPLSAGKVRDIYAPDEAVVGPAPQTATLAGRPRHAKAGPEALLMVTSDRISAYDYVLPTLIPGKGAVLNQLAIWWMGQLRPLVETTCCPSARRRRPRPRAPWRAPSPRVSRFLPRWTGARSCAAACT